MKGKTKTITHNSSDYECAVLILQLEGKLDKYGTPMVSIENLLWAARVKIWFNNLAAKVKSRAKHSSIPEVVAANEVNAEVLAGRLKIYDRPYVRQNRLQYY